MQPRNHLRSRLRRKLRSARIAASASAPVRGSATLLRRAQQWLSARERLLAVWVASSRVAVALAHPSMPSRARRIRSSTVTRLGGAGAITVPHWWEYESPLKRRLALEATLRRLFSVVPESAPA